MTVAHAARSPRDILVGAWLLVIAGLVAAMVLVGGATRLTDSGLSITEWNFAKHFVPPLSERGWQDEFALYQRTTEYQIQNRGMALADFKVIYFWEWGHRFLGQMIGLVFALPYAAFLLTGRLKGRLAPVTVLFAMGGLQGFIGWWMVTSGLYGRLDVSSVRLAIHLAMAFAIIGTAFWLALDALRPRDARAPGGRWVLAFAALVYSQVILGALVAGAHAGRAFADWPTINREWVPSNYGEFTPFWTNLTENLAAVQFHHRTLGYVVLAAALTLAARFRGLGTPVAAIVIVQVLLGVATIVTGAPAWISLIHQTTAVALWMATVAWARAVK